MNMPHSTPPARRGFTLIELLTVIAIIAILASILVPTVSVALVHVKKAKTAVQLSNLVNMSRMYKTQYHIWPTFSTTPSASNDTPFQLKANAPRFVNIMMGQPESNDVQYNKLKIPFASFGESDLSTDPSSVTPVDPFGNDDLYLVFNTNLNAIGQISPSTVSQVTMVSMEEKMITVDQNPNVPIYSDCVGLSPGVGLSNSDAVTTWSVTPQ